MVNHPPQSASLTTVKSLPDLAELGTADYQVVGNEMELRIPRSMLGLSGSVSLSFHWADNTEGTGSDVPDFGVLGDNAPNRRASYRFAPW